MSYQIDDEYIPTNYKQSNANVCGINIGIMFSVLLIYVGTVAYVVSSIYFGLHGSS